MGLFAGIGLGMVLGLVLGRFGPSDLLSIDPDNFVATGIILDGMRRAFGVSIFTILLMGLVGGLTASGLLDRLIAWVEQRANSARGAEWWIFGSISGATILTTHSAVAILTVGSLARTVGSNAGVGPYRRANILDVTVCTYPFLLPVLHPDHPCRVHDRRIGDVATDLTLDCRAAQRALVGAARRARREHRPGAERARGGRRNGVAGLGGSAQLSVTRPSLWTVTEAPSGSRSRSEGATSMIGIGA